MYYLGYMKEEYDIVIVDFEIVRLENGNTYICCNLSVDITLRGETRNICEFNHQLWYLSLDTENIPTH